MLRELLPYLGYDTNQIPENAEIFFVLNNAPKSWMAFVFFAVNGIIMAIVYHMVHNGKSRTGKRMVEGEWSLAKDI